MQPRSRFSASFSSTRFRGAVLASLNMSRSGGRGRDASRRFHTLPSRLPFPPGVTPSQTGLTAVAEPGQRRTHNLPRNVIPGLGLGLSAASPAQQGSPPAAADGAGGSRASVSEEGEVSEGTDDDVYKNNAPPGRPVLTKSLMGPPGSIQRGSSRLATRGRGINAHAQPGPANASRQRSGSYSPYLSPREVNNAHSSPGHNKRALLGQPPRSLTNTLASASDLPRASPANGGLVEASTETTLRLAKQKAKDAILQLWPLNIRYDDYLKEGIDGGILGTLFKDLELDFVEDATPPQQPKAQDIAMAEAPAPQKGQDAPAAKTKLVPSEMTKEEVSKAADKSEERKDRIARLLAAKGSKATASTPSNPTASISTPASVKVAQSSQKAQSEKSKLLQQKMEALRKSRESLLRPPSQQPEKATASLEAGKPSDPDAAANVIASAESRDFLDRLSETGKPSPSVPTTRQPSQSSDSLSQHNRPALSLADRDDDDDDAEMDMDSPIRPFGDRPDTPSKKATVPSAATNVNSRQGLTPTPADTPTRSLGPGSGEDLASMNKRIEAMKRKIAQAEARKRIKLSAQASPAASQQNDNSRCVSVEAGSIPSALSPEGNRTPLTVNSTAAKSASVPHDRPLRPINPVRSRSGARQRRSVTASERLPLIEARRKEQLLKLKMLQSEMAKIERDIAEGMQEEDELKQDLIDSGSGSEHQAGALPEVGPMGSAQTSGVGSVSHSPVISEEISDRNNDKTEISGSNPAELAWDGADTTADDESAKTSTMATQATTVADRTGEPMVGPAHESVEADGDVMMEDLDDGQRIGELPPAASRAKGSALNVPTTSKGDGRGKEETVPQMKPAKRGQQSLGGTSDATNGHFVPYETPLQCFRAYRFHPEFGKRVDGGLRSLTYSNKIDVQKQVCPDELAGQPCPRDGQCDYQHFESMKAPDDQILLQLGAAGHYQEAQKQQYIAGLRELLTDLRNRKVKDFNTISQGIIDYRARFLGDVSKILPLGSVTL
ncbi:hypothetical protein XA68_14683 [Ophiocordyceps unilateralis]|uniref:C3H1-type domain-containing protein n=1 Tax=Ophiocordyceps unilateralis TaxID=268505 RepID=A0A2A9PA08_OPHUN|nr:hypothetical protein XA68_14683 [Ophiocordyceps unilateralis]